MNVRCRGCGTSFPLTGNPGDTVACPGCGKVKRISAPVAQSVKAPSTDPVPEPAPASTGPSAPPIRFLLLMGGAGLLVFLLLAGIYRVFFHEAESGPAVAAAEDARPPGAFDAARDVPVWGDSGQAETVVQSAASSSDAKPLEEEWRAAREIISRGGRLGVARRQQAEETLESNLALDRNLHVIAIELEGPNHSDENLATLTRLPYLIRLDLSRVDPDTITDVGFKHVSGLSKLEYLDVSSLKISRQAVSELSKLKNLRVFNLAKTRLNDDGLKPLAALTSLESLDASDTKVTGAGFAHLAPLKRLRNLNVRGIRLTPDDLRHLSPLVSLEELYLPVERLTALEVFGLEAASPPKARFQSTVTSEETARDTAEKEGFIDYVAGVHHLSSLVRLRDIRMLMVFGTYDERGEELLQSPRWTATFPDITVEFDYQGRGDAPDHSQMTTDANRFRYFVASWMTGKRSVKDLPNFRAPLLAVDPAGRRFFQKPELLETMKDHQKMVWTLSPYLVRPSGKLLQTLKRMEHVTSLDLSGICVRDEDLANISGLTNLEVLDLGGSPITGKGLAHLSTLKNLKYLRLTGTRVGDDDLKALLPLAKLTDVVVIQTAVTEKGMDWLESEMPRLKVLRKPTGGEPWWLTFDWEKFSVALTGRLRAEDPTGLRLPR